MSGADYQRNRQWSDKFIRHFRMVAGYCITAVSSVEEDCQHNTDLIVLIARNVRIACRVRRHKYFDMYPNEFTIRCRLGSGTRTELDKIRDGWGDYLVYAFADEAERNFCAYRVIDLARFREALPGLTWKETPNGDGTFFAAFDARNMPSGVVVLDVKR